MRDLNAPSDNVIDIPSLTAEVDRLNQAIGFWNTTIIVLMIGVAVVATGLVIAQQMAFRRADALAKATDNLSKLKESKANEKIAATNERASRAEQGASEANERAAKAQSSLGLAEQHSAEANSKAEGFRLDIAKANEGASRAQAQVANAQRDAAEANKVAEAERLARLQLEARLADRTLSPAVQSQLTSLAKGLATGRVDICTFGGSYEVENFGRSVSTALISGGWTVRMWQMTGGSSARGMLIGTAAIADKATQHAASQIVDLLHSAGIASGLWSYDALLNGVNSGMRNGPPHAIDAPILMVIGGKQ